MMLLCSLRWSVIAKDPVWKPLVRCSPAVWQSTWVKPASAFAMSLYRNKSLNLSRCPFLASPANDTEIRVGANSINHGQFWWMQRMLGCSRYSKKNTSLHTFVHSLLQHCTTRCRESLALDEELRESLECPGNMGVPTFPLEVRVPIN